MSEGFTLIELSIVIIIIGLIVGAIVVGRDLIRAAEIRATITQINKYDSAVNTFKAKYGYLPGDMLPAVAAQFGFFTFTGANAGTYGFGDGNGQIEGYWSPGYNASYGYEQYAFWRHLSDAHLIDGAYGSIGSGALDPTTGEPVGFPTVTDLGQVEPLAKLGGQLYFRVNYWYNLNYVSGLSIIGNYYMIAGWQSGYAPEGYTTTMASNDASAIDTKIDDGMPFSGHVLASGNSWSSSPSSGKCVTGGGGGGPSTTSIYNNSFGDVPSCYMLIQVQF